MKHQKSPSVMKLCTGAASCIFFGLIMSQLYGQTWPPDRQNDRSLPDIRSSSAAASDPTLTSLEASSSIFESTLRSCLGANCFDKDAHDSNGIAIDRVGLLAPINSGGEEILLFMTKYIEQPRKSKKTPIELVYETHVPPYGYGKNHGWSRIIRLTRKVCPHALSLVAGLKLDEPNSNGGIKNTDMTRHKKFSAAVDIQTRQLIRWQCRLNHVAAHTKLLTVFIEDLVERPAAILDMMMTFSGVTFSRSSMLIAIPDFISSLKRNLAFSAVPLLPHSSNPADNVIAINDKSEQLLRIPNELLGVCVSAILDEIRSTDGLTRWPCNSFRKIEPYGKAKVIQSSESLSIEGKLLMSSSMLAANCSSPFVKCSVSYDRAGG